MNQLEKLADARQKVAGQKYIMSDGTNQAMYRNNILDIREELADALTILKLFKRRLELADKLDLGAHKVIVGAWNAICLADAMVNRIYVPSEMRKDEIAVDRILPENWT